MRTVAILGAGPIGSTTASTLAFEERCSRVVLIDESADRAAGKALDVLQACPIAKSDTRIESSVRDEVAASADVIIVADRAADGVEWQGEAGLAAVARLLQGANKVPVLFAGVSQTWLIERVVREVQRPRHLILGTAAIAFEAAARLMTALEADRPTSDVTLKVAGRPPKSLTVLWESAIIAGEPAVERLDAAALRRIDARLPALWPPGPYALATAAAIGVTAILDGPERAMTCFVVHHEAEGAAMWPGSLGPDGFAIAASPSARLRRALGV